MCFRQCRHVFITDDMLQQSLYEASKINELKSNAIGKHEFLEEKDRELIGAVAQNAVIQYFKDKAPDEFKFTPYYVEDLIGGDDYDLFYRGAKIDVKGSKFYSKKEVLPKTNIFFLEHQKDKPISKYIAVKVDLENHLAHIVGIIDRDKIWLEDNKYKKPYWKVWGYLMFAEEFQDINQFLLGV